MSYYEEKTGELFKTTAIYPNRIKDKQELESICDLKEDGKPDIEFLTKDKKTPLAQGYIRIVYGDHGPYCEMLKDNIIWKSWRTIRTDIGYYNIYNPIDGSNIVLYDQRAPVINLKNPPKGPRSFKGNRKEGYADYRVGRLYLNPYDILIRNL